jgi:pyruvate/2-oxoglutarate/acetoin dehydrogenase E1 component/TPP-dependent pyruvate/acetoin dehydrogenase alpha subunit
MVIEKETTPTERSTFLFTRDTVLRDYRIAFQSREASVIGRREVFTGRAKFGIFGDGKEVAQMAMARSFRKGDFRSGYYRDQTLMFGLGLLRIDEYFAQLYADAEPGRDPCSGGRQMNSHFSTQLLTEEGAWISQVEAYNSSADMSPTASQMPRLVGLAYASHLYRNVEELAYLAEFSNNGDEIAWGTIGDASCSEGLFWESVNAAGALKAPMLLSIWDDGYGISVPTEFHITKGHLSSILKGFHRESGDKEGFDLYSVRGWDYPSLCEVYAQAAEMVRREHVPAIVHVTELTQPLGHSTSGSHERYKSTKRLEWEREHDCLARMRQWMIEEKIVTSDELGKLESEDRELVRELQRRAWENFRAPIDQERTDLLELMSGLGESPQTRSEVVGIADRLDKKKGALREDILGAAQKALIAVRHESGDARQRLIDWRTDRLTEGERRYGSHLYSETDASALVVQSVPPSYDDESPTVNGFEVINQFFESAFERYPNLIAFGEDVGKLGDVNQGFMGLQEKFGSIRVADTGIREATIVGQAIGMALRGLKPVAEIQYLDYLLYALQIMSDDLATLHWRTRGRQRAPAIIRTRGHRLEGVWHSGSPMASILHLVRGIHLCVPRDMTRAAGMYNTLLQSDEPGIVVEVLNGYRVKERLPSNLSEMTVPLGYPETLREGRDVSIVTYGACCRIALQAAERLASVGIDSEVIDIQTLEPFDRENRLLESVKKTNRVVFLDEDVPGGASAYMMQQVVEAQEGYHWLDSEPRTVTARAHRPAYGSDGDYFSKPSREDVFEATYRLMHGADPNRYPAIDR